MFTRKGLRDEQDWDRAFTLIELLVVMTITSLLMSLILHGVGAAKRRAELALCQSHISQLTTSSYVYASENKGYMMPCGINNLRPYWGYFMGDYPETLHNEEEFRTSKAPINIGALFEYMDITSDATRCPGIHYVHFDNSQGNPEHENWCRPDWERYGYEFKENWFNIRSSYVRRNWGTMMMEDGEALEGSGLNQSNLPNKSRMKLRDLPPRSVFYMDICTTGASPHDNTINIGNIGGGARTLSLDGIEVPQMAYSGNYVNNLRLFREFVDQLDEIMNSPSDL